VRSTDQQDDEAWRQHMAEQAELQTRELREIANNTAWTKTVAMVVLALLVLGFILAVVLGGPARL
jgi:Ni/Co efflux regulator RcnB